MFKPIMVKIDDGELYTGEDFSVMSKDSCQANSLNYYFEEILFENYQDYHKKQEYNCKLSHAANTKYHQVLSKRVAFVYKQPEEEATKKKKKQEPKYYMRNTLFSSTKNGNLKSKLKEFLTKLSNGKYTLIYYYRLGREDGKSFHKTQGHMLVIKKENERIFTISNEGNNPEYLPHVDFKLNDIVLERPREKLHEVKKLPNGIKVKLTSIEIHEYVSVKSF